MEERPLVTHARNREAAERVHVIAGVCVAFLAVCALVASVTVKPTLPLPPALVAELSDRKPGHYECRRNESSDFVCSALATPTPGRK
jgi:hypothetical protein